MCTERFNKCYMLLDDTTKFSKDTSWLNAQSDICNANGFALVNLHSKLEMDFVAQQLMYKFSHVNNKAAFIGLYIFAHQEHHLLNISIIVI